MVTSAFAISLPPAIRRTGVAHFAVAVVLNRRHDAAIAPLRGGHREIARRRRHADHLDAHAIRQPAIVIRFPSGLLQIGDDDDVPFARADDLARARQRGAKARARGAGVQLRDRAPRSPIDRSSARRRPSPRRRIRSSASACDAGRRRLPRATPRRARDPSVPAPTCSSTCRRRSPSAAPNPAPPRRRNTAARTTTPAAAARRRAARAATARAAAGADAAAPARASAG